MTEDIDFTYVKNTLDGDTNAFKFIIDKYKNLVFSLAFKTLKNREDAEEVAQDAFLKVYKSLNAFNWNSKFSTWIYKITYNTCLDYLKKKKKEQVYIEDLNEHAIAHIERCFDSFDEKEKSQKVEECILLLPSEDAFLITLYYFDDQSIEEISKILNLSESNVKVRLFRCRKKLATLLKTSIKLDIYE